MAKSRDSYIVTGRTVDELARSLTFLLQRMADRMDKIEGIRGTSSIESNLDMNLNRVTDVGPGSGNTDAARLGDLLTQPLILDSGLTVHELTTLEDTDVNGDIQIFDADGHLIHSLE